MLRDDLREKLDTLPTEPGVYVFRGAAGTVLYVGKARSLRARVRSYFQAGSSDARYFVARLERELDDVETFVTGNEKEAALLESELVKQLKPRFNVKLKDDKSFITLRLDPRVAWPRLEVVRRPRPDGARYFGPYDSATAARKTLRLVNRFFQLRTCSDAELASRTRPCLQYQIKRCPGPCVLDVDRAAYGVQVDSVSMFLEGRHDALVNSLRARMANASSALEYERAATYRDQLAAVESVREGQRIATVSKRDEDVIGLHRQADRAELALLTFREGKLVGVRTFAIGDAVLPDSELVASFVHAYYAEGHFIPSSLLVPIAVDDDHALEAFLSERKQRRVEVRHPLRGKLRALIALANQNAAHAFQEKRRAKDDLEARLEQIREKLRLESPPRRIECVDISHLGGADAVAALVALRDGEPDRARYRGFHLKRARAGDDYGAMREVFTRRLKRAQSDDAAWELPDLFVVDGGRGQLAAALSAMQDLGIHDVPIVALAKEKENVAGETLVDRVYLVGQKNPIAVHTSPALTLLALARDEAHRSSNHLRTKLGAARQLKGPLDDVRGVGAATKKKLLRAFGSLEALRAASAADWRAAGATAPQVAALLRAFARSSSEAARAPANGAPDVPEPPERR